MTLYFDMNYNTITTSIQIKVLQQTMATQTKQLHMDVHTDLLILLHSLNFYCVC